MSQLAEHATPACPEVYLYVGDLDKVALLRTLYAHAAAFAMGESACSAEPLPLEEAVRMVEENERIEDVRGRPILIGRMSGPYIVTRLFDEHYGAGAAQAIANALRAGGK